MHSHTTHSIITERIEIKSTYLNHPVLIDAYLPSNITDASTLPLLLINDGQDLTTMGFEELLENLLLEGAIKPVLCIGIHASTDRRMEYGVASQADYLGRGAKAGLYSQFIMKELLPFLKETYRIPSFSQKAFAGFSLGGLTAMDIVWNNSDVFSLAGIFSGSFWWRTIDQSHPDYIDDKHRIMQQEIRKGLYRPGLSFFFQTGTLDETADRNNNGIIDSIEDTTDIIDELVAKGYNRNDIFYLELADGRHDVATWGRAMIPFLKWAWPNN